MLVVALIVIIILRATGPLFILSIYCSSFPLILQLSLLHFSPVSALGKERKALFLCFLGERPHFPININAFSVYKWETKKARSKSWNAARDRNIASAFFLSVHGNKTLYCVRIVQEKKGPLFIYFRRGRNGNGILRRARLVLSQRQIDQIKREKASIKKRKEK